jgi:UDP-N-acetylglucosamine--N-acetylmuramyl-(pentapeptide) pyrophosphoryl-undecaprenol N-acetylglucosamine transferase
VPDRPAGSAPYVVVDYLERMDLAYAAADLALCRSGAVTVAELSAVGLPAAFVPLPIGNGEQRLNAVPVVEAGGGLLVADADLTPPWIEAQLVPLLTDPARLAELAAHAAAAGTPDADERLADLVLDVATRGATR